MISEAKPEVSIYYRDQPVTEFKSQRLLAADNDFFLGDDFTRAIDTGGRTILDARTSRQITAIVNAAIQSGRSGKSEVVRPMNGAR